MLNLEGIKVHCQSLQDMLALLSSAPTLNYGSSPFENNITIQSLIHNFTAGQAAMHA